jgi:2-C-methyl-D-erythritol 4-phosphate cytidylyltransferase
VPERIWFVIAAAGAAKRFGGSIPKPYLKIGGKTLIEHSLRALESLPGVAGGAVVLAPGDRRFRLLPARVRHSVVTTAGGPTRALSVLNGLKALVNAADDDWVLVHDAARPCLPRHDLEALVTGCSGDPVGGLLAVPVADTVKKADAEGRAERTVSRDALWRAQTPQMFRRGRLQLALTRARERGLDVTDEASAIEWLGLRPKLIEGSSLNIKITRPTDLVFAQAAMRATRRRH